MAIDKKRVTIAGESKAYQPKVQPQDLSGKLAEGDDLATSTKATLGSYMFDKSTQSKQAYTVKDTPTLQNLAPSFNNPETPGKTPDIVPGGMDPAVETFFESLEKIPAMAPAVADFKADGYHEVPSILGSKKTLADFIDKTTRSKENNEILANFDSDGGGYGGYKVDGGSGLSGKQSHYSSGPEVQTAISAALLQNRFNPNPDASPFIREGKTSRNDDKSGDLISHPQTALGVYVPGDNNSAIGIKQMQQLGLALMIRATGHDSKGASTYRMSEDDAFLGSFEQFMLDRVNQDKLDVREVMKSLGIYGAPEQASLPGTTNTELTDSHMHTGGLFKYSHGDAEPRITYGHLNSPIEPFGGPLPTGMLFISVVSVGGLILVVGTIMSAIRAGADPFKAEDANSANSYGQLGRYGTTWKFKKGTYTPKEGKNDVFGLFMELFGIPQTRVPFDVCFTNGLNAFYGFAEGSITDAIQGTYDIDLEFVIERAIDLIRSPGYYAVVMRNVIRDVEQIIDSVEKAIASFTTPGGLGALTDIFGIVEAITSSTTWRFIMTMVGIGDAIACDKFKVFHPLSIDIDDVNFDTPFIQYKSRINPNEPALAWGNQTATSLFLLPKSLQHMAVLSNKIEATMPGNRPTLEHLIGDVDVSSESAPHLDKAAARATELSNPGKRMKPMAVSSDSNRLSRALVDQIENNINATYMPFYFHDLRTNEIINFHAFLESLTENYAPEWNQIDGYGRVDSVQIYKKTARTINVSFIAVATNNDDDLDHMWYKINKLVSMVYPQFDKGKTMISPTGRKFRQPGSQQVATSPVIRLRVGDMIRSNYSRTNMARQFGFDEAEVRSSFSPNIKAEQRNRLVQEFRKGVDREVAAYRKRTVGQQETVNGRVRFKDFNAENIPLKVGDFVRVNYGQGGISIEMNGTDRGPRNPPKNRMYVGPIKEVKKGTPTGADGLYKQEDIQVVIELNNAKLKLEEDADNIFAYRGKEAASITVPLSSCNGANRYQYQYVIRPKVMEEVKSSTQTTETSQEGSIEYNMSKFLSPITNPIIRSFENSGGQGIAGVITSLDFDYNLAEATWTTSIGRRTTKSLKISFAFTVIHDITPGLDYTGGMRALSHPLGSYEGAFGAPHESALMRRSTTILREKKEKSLYDVEQELNEDKSKQDALNKKAGSI